MRRRRGRRRPGWLLLLGLLAGAGVVAWPHVESHPAFRVEVIHLEGCPADLRRAAAEALQPLLGLSFFEAIQRAEPCRRRLAAAPEVASATLACRPPNRLELGVVARVPRLAVRSSAGWLSVDDGGHVIRVGARPEPNLTQVHGLAVRARPGEVLDGAGYVAARAARLAADEVFGRPVRTIAVEPGGGLRLRDPSGDLILLGAATDLAAKLRLFVALRNRLAGPAEYFDVSVLEAPAWRPAGAPAGDTGTNGEQAGSKP